MINEESTKTIGILTRNVRLYYDITKFLKFRNIHFRILDFKGKIPRDIGVILTSQEELDSIDFHPKVAVTDLEADIRKAIQETAGMTQENILIIGVDPGPMPGIAAISKARIIETRQAQNIPHAADIIYHILSDYAYSQAILRIGDGSPEERDLLLELLEGNFDLVEIVDEASTSRVGEGHEDAAVRIAKSQ